jgi:hypothetical protein
MSQLCPRCYSVVPKTCETQAEVAACSYMQRVMMHGMAKGGTEEWDVDTKAGLARAVEWMQRHVAIFADQGRWMMPRSCSIIVIDKKNKQAIRVAGFLPETSTQKIFEAMGWTWVDKA